MTKTRKSQVKFRVFQLSCFRDKKPSHKIQRNKNLDFNDYLKDIYRNIQQIILFKEENYAQIIN